MATSEGCKCEKMVLERLRTYWSQILCNMISWCAASAQDAGRSEIVALDIINAVKQEAFAYAGYRKVNGTRTSDFFRRLASETRDLVLNS